MNFQKIRNNDKVRFAYTCKRFICRLYAGGRYADFYGSH